MAQLPIDLSELPQDVLTRLEERARAPDRRLMVGRYVIVGELGRGGMGVVYEAWDPRIERRVAIKTIEPDLVPEEDRDEVIERFRRETKVVGRLHHPGIVTIYDYGEEASGTGGGLGTHTYYYVMEYLEGHSLARILRERRTLPDVEAVSIVAEIGEALQVSHAAGVIHRDIKPSNIFLRNDKQAVLLDFGIAKTGSVALTRQGQILGTPSYLAPERLKEKEKPVDGRADIFSLGVLLFTMLTGEAPFVGEDIYDVIDKIAKVSHPKLARSTPSGQALSRVIDRMLAKRPDDRYPTASEAAQALRGVLSLLKVQVPEIGDLVSAGVRVREPLQDAAQTEIATPSNALVPVKEPIGQEPSDVTDAVERRADEEDTGRQAIKATDVGSPETPVRVADLLGTRPEIALQRETKEIGRDVRSIPPPLPSMTVFDPKKPARDGLGDTAPAKAAEESGGTEFEETYDSHAPSNDEATDDHTVAEAGAQAEAARKAAASRRKEVAREVGRNPWAEEHPAVAGALPKREGNKHPSGPSPVPPTLSTKSPSHGTAAPSLPRGASAAPAKVTARAVSALPSKSKELKQDRIQTEEIVRASAPEHSEAKTENDRGAAGPQPTVRPTQAKRPKRTSRIEASLVDEDDVVVKPAPLDTLKPDELPTQTGFRLPPGASTQSGASPIPSSQTVNEDVVRVRGEGRIPDPAEPPHEGTQNGALVSAGEGDQANGTMHRADIELSEDSGPVPDVDAPQSAAVARRTFDAARTNAGRSQRAVPGPTVQVRVSGSAMLSPDRRRVMRRRGFMLIAAALAAVAVGLLLGRMKQRSTAINVDPPGDAQKPVMVEPPRASQVSLESKGSEPELVRPRPAQELVQDASAALTEGRIAKAERLFESAVRAAPEKSRLRAQAMLGRADALQRLGGKEAAIQLYRTVIAESPKSKEGDEAKVALGELGVSVEAPRDRAAPSRSSATGQGGGAKRSEGKEATDSAGAGAGVGAGTAGGEAKSAPLAPAITADMSPDEKCLALAAKHIKEPKEAIRALNKLARDEPKSSCVYWHLGNSYAKVHDDRAALASYRRYLELRPDAQNRAAVDARIKNLEAKLEQR